jgi:putative holliday junction resolvase
MTKDIIRIMGLDIGDKTIGLAVSDPLGWTAQGLDVIRRKSIKKDLQKLGQWIRQYEVQKVVVGLPLNMDGSLSGQAGKNEKLVQTMRDKWGKHITVETWDERLTTQQAERVLLEADVSRKRRKEVIDKIAAVLILQNYIDAQGKTI